MAILAVSMVVCTTVVTSLLAVLLGIKVADHFDPNIGAQA